MLVFPEEILLTNANKIRDSKKAYNYCGIMRIHMMNVQRQKIGGPTLMDFLVVFL